MKIIIIASDIHVGGGKVVLNDLLVAAMDLKFIDFHVLIDSRFNSLPYNSQNISFIEISKIKRIFYVNKIISNIVEQEDVILNISGLPFFKKYKCSKVQYIMIRYFIDRYSTHGLPTFVRLRLALQKLAFSLFLSYADYIFVQNSVMKGLLNNLAYSSNNIEVIPYKNIDLISSSEQKIKESLIYVASEEAHKNHLNLIHAWVILAKENIYPTLILTIDDKSNLCNEILIHTKKYNLNIIIKSRLERDELLSYYGKVNGLIYPSFFECFGIPILEALNYNLPIIASELDYVRDFVNPAETFDPNSPKSIARAVKRFFGHEEKMISVLSAKEFTKEIVLYANK